MKQTNQPPEIGYQPTSDSYPGSELEGIHVRSSFSQTAFSESYIHESVVVEPGLPVRCFSYEDVGVLVPGHWHNSLEILYLDAGSMEVSLEDQYFLLNVGDFVIINSRQIHATDCSEHSRVCVLQIPYPFLKQHMPDYDSMRFISGRCGQPKTDQAFYSCLTGLQACCNSRENGFQLHFKALLFELLYLCVTHYQQPAGQEVRRMTDVERARLIKVMDYVNAHYNEPISLRDAASMVALNPEYFCRFFKKNMGLTFLEFVNQVRFSHMCEDILRTDTSITELLARHGFTNYKLFRRMFYEKYGCTPQAKRAGTRFTNQR